MKKGFLFSIVFAALLCFASPVYAATFDPGGWSYDGVLISSEKAPHEYIEISASGSNINVKGETTLPSSELSLSAQTIKPGSSKLASVWIGRIYTTDKGAYCSFSGTIDVMNLQYSKLDALYTNQNYRLYIKSNGKTFYSNANFNVDSKGNVHIIEWDKVVTQNEKMRNLVADPADYLDITLSDLRDVDGISSLAMTSSEAKYVADVSDLIVGNASTDVQKALKIHDYIATNIYYDNLGNSGGAKQYYHPYETLYNMRNNIKAPNTDGKGKVATTCVGYAGLTIALARSQDIPARLCNGHHVRQSVPYDNWNSEANVSKIDHWWAELYIDGQWYVVDPVPASGNKWERSSSSSTGTWKYTGLSNRTSFMPTIEQLSTTHVTYNVFGGGESSSGTATSLSAPVVKASNVASTGKIKVTWGKVAGAEKYELWRSSTGKTGSYSKVYTTSGTSVTHGSATPGKSYYYRVRAVGASSAASAYSTPVQRMCDYARPKLSVGLTSAGKPYLTWTSCSGALNYQVWYSTSKNGTYKMLYKTPGLKLSHTSAKSGSTYYYKVRAVGASASACGSFSSIVSKRASGGSSQSSIPQYSYYIINKNSGIFHRPTCVSVNNMSDSNKLKSTKTYEQLEKAGYKPCKNCL